MSSESRKQPQESKTLPTSSRSSSAVTRLQDKYSSAENFLVTCNPSFQSWYIDKPMQAFKHDAPTLGILNTAFGTETANAWLIPELVAVSEFCGCRDKLTDSQLEETARIITASYPWLKVSELLLFFGWLKQGKYGRFYGCLDPMVITTSLQDFICDRALYLEKVAQQERDKQAEEEKKKPHFTREEWEKIKQQKMEE